MNTARRAVCPCLLLAAVLAGSPVFAQTFHLKSAKTGKIYGPFNFVDGAKLRIGKAAFTIIKSKTKIAKTPNKQTAKPQPIINVDLKRVIVHPDKYRGKILRSTGLLGGVGFHSIFQSVDETGKDPGGEGSKGFLYLSGAGDTAFEFRGPVDLNEKIIRIQRAVGKYGRVSITYRLYGKDDYLYGRLISMDLP